MIKRYTNHFAVCIIFFLLHQLSAQQNQIVDSLDIKSYEEQLIKLPVPDSIINKNYSYEELYYYYYNYSFTKKNKTLATAFANAYINLSKTNKDSLRLAEGYYSLGFILNKDLATVYMDSVITLTKNLNNPRFPASAYYFKGTIFSGKRAFKKALDSYILANEYARKNYNTDLIFKVNNVIGLLKDRIGDHKEALFLFKENYNYLKHNNGKKTKNRQYLSNLFSITTSFYRLRELDSATYYANIGMKESLARMNTENVNRFTICKGVIDYLRKDYDIALNRITKSVEYFQEVDDKPNLAVGYYYLGKINYESDNKEKGIFYFKQLDTIFQQQKDILPETRNGYEMLIDYYKKTNNPEQQLVYIEKLIKVDSVLNSNYRYLQKKITQNYDTPLLIQEKDKIIGSLENEQVVSRFGIIGLTVISIITGVFLFLNYTKKKKYQKRFESLLTKKEVPKETPIVKESEKKEAEDIGISETIVQHILASLDDFEGKKEYLTPNITTAGLAKQFETNAKYLSKVINFYKQKSFIAYINDLRVDYVVEKLQTDQKLRNYTIKAIAREIGFNTTEAFSKSFLKKTGIYPSYFIKQLEKKKV
ncbi:helix-turn-helix domain-containing protein [Aquimarina sp. 433]